MIKQTIYPKILTQIAPVSDSYRFNGGTATLELDSQGNYELTVNGRRHSDMESSAKRDAGYKRAVALVSEKMERSFAQREQAFVGMHRDAATTQTEAEYRSRRDSIVMQRYEREEFPLARPMRDEVRKELEREAAIRFADIYDDRRGERMAFVNEHEKEAMAARLRGYEEVQAFFAALQDEKESQANAQFQKEYERKVGEIDRYIEGDENAARQNIRDILDALVLPFRVEISCSYDKSEATLMTDIELYGDLNLPTTKATTLTSGRISVKDKLIKEQEQCRTETLLSLVFYVAAQLFNATVRIHRQQVTLWLDGRREGLMWIAMERDQFAQLDMETTVLLEECENRPFVGALRTVRGAVRLDTMEAAAFKNAIRLAEAENNTSGSHLRREER